MNCAALLPCCLPPFPLTCPRVGPSLPCHRSMPPKRAPLLLLLPPQAYSLPCACIDIPRIVRCMHSPATNK